MELVRDIGRATATGLAFVAGCLGTAALIILIFQSHELLEKVTSDAGVALVELLKMAIPLLGGVLLARATWKRFKSRARAIPMDARIAGKVWLRRLLWVAVFLYGLTCVMGGPAVQTVLDSEAFEAWKRLEARDHKPGRQEYPSIRTPLVLPIAPTLIVTYHEAQIGILGGWGGWQLYFWYGTAPKRLLRLTSWVS